MAARSFLVLMMAAAVALAGCGDDGDGGDGDNGATDTPTPTPTDPVGGNTTPSPTESEPRDPVTWEVEVSDNSFSPSSLTVQVGDTVRWVHTGSEGHTVTADDGTFDSHPDCDGATAPILGDCMEEGDSFEWTFEEEGEVAYSCKLHNGMDGSIEALERHDATPDDA